MLAQSLQEAAGKFGKFCPVKNELVVRKGRKTHRFIFGDGELRVVFPDGQEILNYFAADMKASDLKPFIARMSASTGP